MGLFQRAVETYDNMSHLAGVIEENKKPLAPIGHNTVKAQIEITINDKGEFNQARLIDDKVLIPVTEDSASRAGQAYYAHPLCDQMEYICMLPEADLKSSMSVYNENNKDQLGDEDFIKVVKKNREKHKQYIDELKKWCDYDSQNLKIQAVYKYVKKGSVFEDISRLCDGKGKPAIKLEFTKEGKTYKLKNNPFIVWTVIGLGDDSGATYKDKKLIDKYIDYYEYNLRELNNNADICYISGNSEIVRDKHLAGVIDKFSNAKLISKKEEGTIRYIGRFIDPTEALTIGSISSQKAHNALKWLLSNQKVIKGDRVFVCWNPNGLDIPDSKSPIWLDNDNNKKYNNPTEYKERLKKKIEGYKETIGEENIIIASFDAASKGRLAVTYYNELKGSDFLDRLEYWDNSCCFYHNEYGISSPKLYDIIKFIFGTQRGIDYTSEISVDEKDNKAFGVYMERLIKCRVDKTQFPMDIMKALCNKANNLQILNWTNRESLLFVTCAVIRKYYIDKFKEVFDMALQKNKKDRSYQYGRLLAVMEKAECDTYEGDEKKKRQTNAIRMQSIFVKRPEYVTKNIIEQLKQAYYPKLGGRQVFYEKLIGEIMDMISECEEEKGNKPLDEKYVIGYYLQKNELWKGKEDKVLESEESENE